eukprot:764861-Hanusia_phi.AAC.5
MPGTVAPRMGSDGRAAAADLLIYWPGLSIARLRAQRLSSLLLQRLLRQFESFRTSPIESPNYLPLI